MTEQGWHAVLTITLETCTGADQALTAHLATAVQARAVPPSVLERLRQALATATQPGVSARRYTIDPGNRVDAGDCNRRLRGRRRAGGSSSSSALPGMAEHQQIEVFLYPDAS